jgi:hypothetical protein
MIVAYINTLYSYLHPLNSIQHDEEVIDIFVSFLNCKNQNSSIFFPFPVLEQ